MVLVFCGFELYGRVFFGRKFELSYLQLENPNFGIHNTAPVLPLVAIKHWKPMRNKQEILDEIPKSTQPKEPLNLEVIVFYITCGLIIGLGLGVGILFRTGYFFGSP